MRRARVEQVHRGEIELAKAGGDHARGVLGMKGGGEVGGCGGGGGVGGGRGVGRGREGMGGWFVWYLSQLVGSRAVGKAIGELGEKKIARLRLLIGPEGGWTGEEIASFEKAGLTGVRIATTILRV